MSVMRTFSDSGLETLLVKAMDSLSAVSLRADGSVRMLGQLRVCELEPGVALQLQGAKHRDQLPPEGTAVTLSLILGDEAVSIQTLMLAPLPVPAGRNYPPILRAAWPGQVLEFHRREDVRVASVDLPSLAATLVHRGRRYPAKVLNLTEMGMGLGLAEAVGFQPQDRVEVETCLPGGAPFRVQGDVRHFEVLEEAELPTRVGLILLTLPEEGKAALARLIQARRMYLSQGLREG